MKEGAAATQDSAYRPVQHMAIADSESSGNSEMKLAARVFETQGQQRSRSSHLSAMLPPKEPPTTECSLDTPSELSNILQRAASNALSSSSSPTWLTGPREQYRRA